MQTQLALWLSFWELTLGFSRTVPAAGTEVRSLSPSHHLSRTPQPIPNLPRPPDLPALIAEARGRRERPGLKAGGRSSQKGEKWSNKTRRGAWQGGCQPVHLYAQGVRLWRKAPPGQSFGQMHLSNPAGTGSGFQGL